MRKSERESEREKQRERKRKKGSQMKVRLVVRSWGPCRGQGQGKVDQGVTRVCGSRLIPLS